MLHYHTHLVEWGNPYFNENLGVIHLTDNGQNTCKQKHASWEWSEELICFNMWIRTHGQAKMVRLAGGVRPGTSEDAKSCAVTSVGPVTRTRWGNGNSAVAATSPLAQYEPENEENEVDIQTFLWAETRFNRSY